MTVGHGTLVYPKVTTPPRRRGGVEAEFQTACASKRSRAASDGKCLAATSATCGPASIERRFARASLLKSASVLENSIEW